MCECVRVCGKQREKGRAREIERESEGECVCVVGLRAARQMVCASDDAARAKREHLEKLQGLGPDPRIWP